MLQALKAISIEKAPNNLSNGDLPGTSGGSPKVTALKWTALSRCGRIDPTAENTSLSAAIMTTPSKTGRGSFLLGARPAQEAKLHLQQSD